MFVLIIRFCTKKILLYDNDNNIIFNLLLAKYVMPVNV